MEVYPYTFNLNEAIVCFVENILPERLHRVQRNHVYARPITLSCVILKPEFYGDLVYKFRKIIGKNDFPYHFKKIVVRYKKIGYNINVMRQTACLVVNLIKVNIFAYLFDCTTVGRTSDRMMVPS